ncbi:cell wall metabolism sensor histidine kinase WalK [Vitiosangium sp. GDMCC 1.1324]|uniref:sensor histidine kinase n=1 Tax=Vitiosangium sp. (strain GDMCC 1.1324) TaxID=2138576 RepID=UPI000D36C772|nr:HAMP domain-containing sensor histidine kinase [Vitiosangium sp. GDMCC 1.1324]PTL79809.1 histidine kinase [Vitiosangium sp. GDMCC 1.1324]
MKLRMRLALTTLAVAIPIVLVMTRVHNAVEVNARKAVLSEYALAFMLAGGRERCEASPETWSLEPPSHDRGPPPRRGGPPLSAFGPKREPPPDWSGERPPPPPLSERPGPPPERTRGLRLFAYDAELSARNPAAPPLDETLVEPLRRGEELASRSIGHGPQGPSEVLVRMPWGSGPCAFVLVQRQEPPDPGLLKGLVPPPNVWLLPTLIALAGVLLSVGPVVRRLRQLTGEVRTFVRSAYQGPITQRGNDEISELARAFDEAGREVHAQMDLKEKREQTLRSFLENTTHDVMIPLTVLQGYLAEMQQRAARVEPVDVSVVTAASQEAHYMAALIHNLGAAARLEAGEPAVQRAQVDLNALVERCMSRHRPIARQLGVALECAVPESPVRVEGDVTLIEQAVSNVVYNAVRYNARDGHVAVVLERTRGEAFRLRVLDDGPGIPENELSRIVERRVRGDAARTRGVHGHGLGLNIAWKVAVLHGWSLELGRSEYGGLQVDFLGELAPHSAQGGEREASGTA